MQEQTGHAGTDWLCRNRPATQGRTGDAGTDRRRRNGTEGAATGRWYGVKWTCHSQPIAVARSMGIQVAYLPGLAMRRIADLHPGTAKTDARDAYVIADAARTLPHTLRRVDAGEEALAELKVLVGFDDDLAGEATRVSNRIRGLLTQVHPAPERVVGPRLTTKQGLALIQTFGGPQGMTKAGKSPTVANRIQGEPASGRRVGRHDHQSSGGTNRDRARYCCSRDRTAETCRHLGQHPRTTCRDRDSSRTGPRCPPSFRSPDLHARCRGPDSSSYPA